MPSSNISPATATVLGPGLPDLFTDSVDHIAVAWYVYTAQAGDKGISVFPFGTPGFSNVQVYAGLAAANAQFPNYLDITGSGNKPLEFPVTAGVQFFLRYVADAGNTLTIDFAVRQFPNLSVSPGTYAVPDSKNGWPVVFVEADGTLKRLIQPYAAGEVSQVLADGTSLSEQFIGRLVKIYDPQFNQIVSTSIPNWTNGHLAAGTNGVDLFYVGGTFSPVVRTIDVTGALGATWTLSGNPISMQPSPDESILYWTPSGSGGGIKRHDLLTDTPLSDLASRPASTFTIPDLIVLGDGRIVAGFTNFSTGDIIINIYNPDGSIDVTTTLNYPVPNSGHRMAYGTTDGSFIFWVHPATNSANSVFLELSTTDLSILDTSPDIATFINGIYMGTATATPIAEQGIPESCAFFVSRVAITSTARLTVVKATIPGGSPITFPFSTTGGLSPANFSLADGDSQVFNDLAPGTYGVSEGTPPSGWTFTGVVVSNGDPNDAINLVAGDDVTATFTNTQTGDECPGLVTHARIDGLPYVPPVFP